ncbi:hypothetical protein CAOG_003724 [Capsaspora owczarzaki ATCC 30864]|uniref:J domain-containing protein n=1 Tax=Capsaspora owczarzaki (strain ATCC 30864) TaxID=595528 RepID=A0A0D2UCQ0_CAPO3|nr:hypothetical protein CAOG_003724 [Capsaspora owczarzaki ATCC 30864]
MTEQLALGRLKFDPYLVLGVPRHASNKDIKRAFYALSRKLHPDVVPAAARAAAHSRFVVVSQAYTILSSPTLRLQYDRLRGLHEFQPSSSSSFHEGSRGFSGASQSSAPNPGETWQQDAETFKRQAAGQLTAHRRWMTNGRLILSLGALVVGATALQFALAGRQQARRTEYMDARDVRRRRHRHRSCPPPVAAAVVVLLIVGSLITPTT